MDDRALVYWIERYAGTVLGYELLSFVKIVYSVKRLENSLTEMYPKSVLQ